MNGAIRQLILLSFLEQYANRQKPRPPIPDDVKAVITRESGYAPVTDRRKRRKAKLMDKALLKIEMPVEKEGRVKT